MIMGIAVDDVWWNYKRNQAGQMEHGDVALVDVEKWCLKTVWMTPTLDFTYNGDNMILNDSNLDIHRGSDC